MEEKFMRRAVELSAQSVRNGGGPFGAVIVRDGEIVGEASNSVTKDNDPTAHAEVNAIRRAAQNWALSILTGVIFILPASRVPCVSGLFIGRTSHIFIIATPVRMPQR